MSQPARHPDEAPEVVALRKRVRGEPLTDDERNLLATATRKPTGPTVPHAAVMAELVKRERPGE
jgi:hypothetical protein